MRWILTLAALACGVLFPSSRAGAWNHTGHRVVGAVAYGELTPAARARVDALLRAHPRYQKDLLDGMPGDYPDPGRYAMTRAAYWPDLIKSPQHPMFLTHNRPDWHTVWVRYELPDWQPATRRAATMRAAATRAAAATQSSATTASAATTTPATAPVTLPVVTTRPTEPGPTDVLEAIALCTTRLKDPATSDADKAVMICWLAHLVGDVHQPLHAAVLYSAQYPRGDNVGSRFTVLRNGVERNLHTVWDEMIGVQYAPRIVDYLAEGLRTSPAHARSALAEEVEVLDPDAWAAESYRLAIDIAYLNGTLPGVNKEDLRQDPTLAIPSLTDDYLRAAEEVAQQRIALAGYRLAALLNEILGGEEMPAARNPNDE